MRRHPFYCATYNGHDFFSQTVDDRIKAVAAFDIDTCQRALAVDGLQNTVRKAIERRIRMLERMV
jgi:hypothetical protein